MNVVCYHWGDWPDFYVSRLYRGVARHLKDFRFICFTDRMHADYCEGVEKRPINWWSRGVLTRMRIFGPLTDEMAGLSGRILVIDLDNVITGDLAGIASAKGKFIVLEDLWQPGRLGGGIYSFEAGSLQAEMFNPLTPEIADRLKGRERFWFRERADDFATCWQHILPGQIVSYKPHGQDKRTHLDAVPDDARVVCFHGKPKPHEVDKGWLREHWHVSESA